MGKYVKSYSNYVLKTKHQNASNGTIYERDITTIGGRDQFAKGQVPIYKSGNFVITVNNDNSSFKKINNGEWYKNLNGDTWTLEITDLFEKESTSSDDRKIEIKKDYHDLRDYAYYGSCSELIRGSIDDILKRYPGELFVPTMYHYFSKTDGSVQYTREAALAAFGNEGNFKKELTGLTGTYTKYIIEDISNPSKHVAETHVFSDKPKDADFDPNNLIVVDNPFGIDMHSRQKPLDADPLKFFANDGIDNYVGYIYENGAWDMSTPYGLDALVIYDGLGETTETNVQFGFVKTDKELIDKWITDLCATNPEEINNIINIRAVRAVTNATNLSQEELDSFKICSGDYLGRITLTFIQDFSYFDVQPTAATLNAIATDGDNIKRVTVNDYSDQTPKDYTFTVYMYMGDDGNVVYMVDRKKVENVNFRIRPKESVINDYFRSLDSFQKILLDRTTDPLFTATFEIIDENNEGYYTYTDTFSFPTTYGGYNLGSNNIAFERYVERLSKISEFYDDRFSDNLWRSMTHEAVKNFDWTFTRRFNEDEREQFTEGGQKIQKIIRLYAREFDEIKGFIDAIKNNNNVSYDSSENMPDYFFTDKLDELGWDVIPIYPLVLNEYMNDKMTTAFNFHDENNDKISIIESANTATVYGANVKVTRTFTQKYDLEKVKPYHIDEEKKIAEKTEFSISKELLDYCNYENDVSIDVYAIKGGECDEDTYYFNDDSEYSYVQINNEFFKRLILNSSDIMRHKGTIDSIEMTLALFNMKKGVDYDIKEYTMFSPYENDTYNEKIGKYEVDFVNSTKTITYNTEDFRNGVYSPYQGLPISYRDIDNEERERRLYPRFQSGAEYDGGMYYQMKGGWLRKKPFMFDTKNNIIPEAFDENNERTKRLFSETVRNIQTTQTISDLLTHPSLAINDGDVVQVLDLSGRYAIIDGRTYPLIYEDTVNGVDYNYFYVSITNNTLIVGNAVFYDNVIISNPYYSNNRQTINLSDEYYDERDIKIYVLKENGSDGNSKYSINVSSNNAAISTFSVFENGKYMEGDNFTNFFRINNVNYFDELSVLGWQQMRDDEYEYFMLNAITDDNRGNNPHSGKMSYDNGHEYLLRFSDIFNYVREHDNIDLRQYDESNEDLLEYFDDFGFTNLIPSDICDKDYDSYLIEDTKCHYFGDYIEKQNDGTYITYKYTYDVPTESDDDNTVYYNFAYSTDNRKHIDVMTTETWIDKIDEKNGVRTKYNEYLKDKEREVDGVTDQIMNTKRFDLIFYITSPEWTVDYLEQVKYYDSVVLNYVTQLIPSTIISCVKYVVK